MITYHQAFDVYHTSFRILVLLHKYNISKIERERLRIFDFILLFPHDLLNVTMPVGAGGIKRKFPETRYNKIPNRKRVFYQIGKYFELSLKSLLSFGIIDIEEYKSDNIVLNADKISAFVSEASSNSIDSEIMEFLVEHFLIISLSELKKRTGLIEYRYDILKTK